MPTPAELRPGEWTRHARHEGQESPYRIDQLVIYDSNYHANHH